MRIAVWCSAPVVLVVAGFARAQAVSLAEVAQPKDCVRVELTTRLDGERIYFQDGEKKKTQKTVLAAEHRFTEKVLAVHANSRLAAKAARHYATAQTTLSLD